MNADDKDFLPLNALVDRLERISFCHSRDSILYFVEGGILGGGNTGWSIKIRETATGKSLFAADIIRERSQSSNRTANHFLDGKWSSLDLSERPRVSRPQTSILDECRGANPRFEISVRSAVSVLNNFLGPGTFDAALPIGSDAETEQINRGGRPRKYDWQRWENEAFHYFRQHFIPEHQRVPTDQEVVKWSNNWFADNSDDSGATPKSSDIKGRLGPVIDSLEKSFEEAAAVLRK